VLILGAGTIGIQAAQCARSLGATDVAIADIEPGRLSVAEEVGIRRRIHLPHEPVDAIRTIYDELGEESLDVVVECTGAPAAVGLVVSAVRTGGTIVQIGLSGKLDVPIHMDRVALKDVNLAGSLSSPGVWPDVIALVTSGEVNTSKLVTDRFPLEQVEAALALLNERSPETLKVSLLVN
jgi:L-iditol 2-dehydrogenase